MGADGHIRIYNLDILQEKFTTNQITLFREQILDSTTYCQTLRGVRYLSRYHGDNIDSANAFDVIYFRYDLKKDKFTKNENFQDKWIEDSLMELTREERVTIHDMVNYLVDECFADTWEVWT